MSKAAFARMRFHIDTVSRLRNRIEINVVWNCLHETFSYCLRHIQVISDPRNLGKIKEKEESPFRS